jgi:hypothetical protein
MAKAGAVEMLLVLMSVLSGAHLFWYLCHQRDELGTQGTAVAAAVERLLLAGLFAAG